MKRIAGTLVFVFALSFMALLQAQDQEKGKGMEMTGTACNAGNVVTTEGKAKCDETKGGKSNDMVVIDDQGNATKVANPEKLKGMSGQKVKINGEMRKIQDEDRMWIYDVEHLSPGI
jgi:hypothetical protein